MSAMVIGAIFSSAGTRSWSSSARRATSRSENECGPNDSPFMPVPTVLSSNQSTPVVKEFGANTHTFGELQIQSWTKHSQIGMHEHNWRLLYRALINLTILSEILSLVSSNQSDCRLSESKAACKLIYRLHKLDDDSLAIFT